MSLPSSLEAACQPVLDALGRAGVQVLDLVKSGAHSVAVVAEAGGARFTLRITPQSRAPHRTRRPPTGRHGRATPRMRVHHAHPTYRRPDWRSQLREAGERLKLLPAAPPSSPRRERPASGWYLGAAGAAVATTTHAPRPSGEEH